jgi:hypothetical protein
MATTTIQCIHCDLPVYIDNDVNDGWPYAVESGGFYCDSDESYEGRHDEGMSGR